MAYLVVGGMAGLPSSERGLGILPLIAAVATVAGPVIAQQGPGWEKKIREALKSPSEKRKEQQRKDEYNRMLAEHDREVERAAMEAEARAQTQRTYVFGGVAALLGVGGLLVLARR